MERRVAVVLSGCGFLDGAEITESVSTLISLSEEGAKVRIFAPDKNLDEVDHLNSENTGSKRNVLSESARIARSKVENLDNLNSSEFDAIVFPGGFGVAKNLCDFASKGHKANVDAKTSSLLKEFHAGSKPIGVFCIAPALCALVLGKESVALTIGNDKQTASEIEKTGAEHIDCEEGDYVTDRANKVISTPAYMYESAPHIVHKGIKGAIRELMEMA